MLKMFEISQNPIPDHIDSPVQFVEVILKTAERCNLNCSYCYFFHGGDDSYKKHPP